MFAWRDQYLSFNGSGPAPSGDPYWAYVSLLENFEYPETAFADSSSNNFLITVNGDTKPSLRTPFNGDSMQFTASSYASMPYNAGFVVGTNNFTIEAWVYCTATTGTQDIFNVNNIGASYSSVRLVHVGGAIYFLCASGSATWINASNVAGAVTTNTWIHFAGVRNGSTFTLYQNGRSILTYTSAVSLHNASGGAAIGGMYNQANTGAFIGYVSNCRFINGTALYTTNFTPPSSPLTSVTNTQILVLNNFTDTGPNSLTVTRTGTTFVSQHGPYFLEGGSLYFDGTGDFISQRTGSANFNYGTGNVTIEFWVYPLTGPVSTYNPAFFTNNSNGDWAAGNVGIRIHHQNAIFGGGTFTQLNFTSAIVNNVWTHIAIVRNGNTITAYKNGIANGTATYTGSLGSNTAWPALSTSDSAGTGGREYLNGYVSNWRIIKGTALYTTNFIPSTTSLTNVAGTSLLVNATNQGLLSNSTFIDSATTSTAALTQVTTPRYSGLSPFGNEYPGSLYCNGSSYVTAASNAGYNINNINFTIEAWINPTNVTGTKAVGGIHVSGTGGWYLGLNGAITRFSSGAADYQFGTISANVWTHIAAVRNGTNLTFYINGVQSGSPVNISAQNFNFTNPLWIGKINTTGWYFDGYITNFRITKSALYTANFTPSAEPLTLEPNTTFLLIAKGGYQDLSNYGQLIDGSTTNAVISTQQKKFGNQAVSFTANGWQNITDSTSVRFGSGDFTIEGWVYRNTNGVVGTIMAKGGSSTGWQLQINASNQLTWLSQSTTLKTSTTTISSGTWTYFAITRTGTTCYMFIDGTQEGGTFVDSSNYSETQQLKIGADRTNTNGLNGYLDDIRVTVGICRYTSTFSAPTESFPTS